MTFGQYIKEALNYEYSAEYLQLMQEDFQIQIEQQYLEDVRFSNDEALFESAGDYSQGFLMESANDDQIQQLTESISDKIKKAGSTIWTNIKKAFKAFVGFFKKLFSKKRNKVTVDKKHQWTADEIKDIASIKGLDEVISYSNKLSIDAAKKYAKTKLNMHVDDIHTDEFKFAFAVYIADEREIAVDSLRFPGASNTEIPLDIDKMIDFYRFMLNISKTNEVPDDTAKRIKDLNKTLINIDLDDTQFFDSRKKKLDELYSEYSDIQNSTVSENDKIYGQGFTAHTLAHLNKVNALTIQLYSQVYTVYDAAADKVDKANNNGLETVRFDKMKYDKIEPETIDFESKKRSEIKYDPDHPVLDRNFNSDKYIKLGKKTINGVGEIYVSKDSVAQTRGNDIYAATLPGYGSIRDIENGKNGEIHVICNRAELDIKPSDIKWIKIDI